MIVDLVDALLGVDTQTPIDTLTKRYEDMELPSFSEEDYSLLSGTAFDDINEIGRGSSQQDMALSMLEEIANQGFSDADRAALERINRNQLAQERMNRDALAQNFARRGVGGSGQEMAAQMLNQAAGADRRAQQGTELAGQAAQNRRAALSQLGSLGTQVRGQDLSLAQNRASARDAMNKFNTQTRNMGVDRDDRLAQLAFDNRFKKATGASEADKLRWQNEQNKRAAATQAIGGGAQTLGQIGSTIGMAMSDENNKTNISDGSEKVKELLDSIGTHSYNYKDPKHGEGTYVSPMAQELEKTELGKDMVIDTPEGKMVDYGRGMGVALSALADINKRLSEAGI